jgi:hypothetical protein
MDPQEKKASRLIVDFRGTPPAIEVKSEHWQAWWEDYDSWDGFAAYSNLDAAMRHSTVCYLNEEYGWDHGDPDEEAPETEFSWAFEHGRWHLLDGEKATGVQLYKVRVYGKKT